MGSERLSDLSDIAQLISGKAGSSASFLFHMKEKNLRLCHQTGEFRSQRHHSGAEWPWRGERVFWSIKWEQSGTLQPLSHSTLKSPVL